MKTRSYSVPFFIALAVLALLVASPALSRVLVLPRSEFFTELYILGPKHMAEDYPFNISVNQNYDVFLGIGDQLGYCAYYLVEVKFRNQTQSGPDSFNKTSSSLPPLFNITAFVADEGVWEMPLTFSFNYEFNETLSQVEFNNMSLNDVTLDLRGLTTTWDPSTNAFSGNLIFELWLFNTATGSFQYHQRFVDLWLNMTVS
jgi:uncharacterized membrane protein